MKNTISLLFLSCLSMTDVSAQNLVPNPDFEIRNADYCGVSSSTDLGNSLSDWYSPSGGSPDVYFTDIEASCWNFQPNSTYPGPIGIKGSQLPRSGSAMSGFATYTIPTFNQREYLQVQLNSSLAPTGKYVVEFYVSLADSVEFSSSGLGFHLSTTAISGGSDGVLSFTPQYEMINPVMDSQNWVRVFDTLIVTDAFQYLTIGNFNDDASTTTTPNPTTSLAVGTYGAYYFLDDVRVERVFDQTTGLIFLDQSTVSIFPNPAKDVIHIELSKSETDVQTDLIDINGKIIWSDVNSFQKRSIDLSTFDKGVYFLRIATESGVFSERILKQ